MDGMSKDARAMLESMRDGAKTVKELHDLTGVSKKTIYVFLKKNRNDDNVDYNVSSTSSSGRPPRFWYLTDKGKMEMVENDERK